MLETISLLVNSPKEIFCIVLSHQKGSLITAVPDMKQQICIYPCNSLSLFLALRTYACNSFACLLWKPTMYVMLFCGELHICCEFVYRQANLCSGLRVIFVLN